MRSFALVTTFNANGYHLYGKTMIQTFLKHWPKEVRLHVYAEGIQVEESGPNLIVCDLHSSCPDLVAFKQRHDTNLKAHGKANLGITPKGKPIGLGFRWDAVRFAHKVYSICHAGQTVESDVLIWIDADTRTFADIDINFLESFIPESSYTCYLGRKGKYTECGFVTYNRRHPLHLEFLNLFKNFYDSDRIFELPEWHDSYVWDFVRKHFENQGMTNTNITENLNIKEGHPFINSPLGQFMDHLKGERKIVGKSLPSDLVVVRTEDYWRS